MASSAPRPSQRFVGAERIIHAGDLGSPAVLAALGQWRLWLRCWQ